jgi:hypothetical protein
LIATLRAVASWLFFRVARSLRINSDMLVFSTSAARTALKNNQLIQQRTGESHVIYGTGHYWFGPHFVRRTNSRNWASIERPF